MARRSAPAGVPGVLDVWCIRARLGALSLTGRVFPIIDVSEWELDSTVSAAGRREKEWLIEPRERRYALFKLPHYHAAESTAEKLASEIGRLFEISVTEVHLAVRHDRHGVISYKFLEPEESLDHGGDLIVPRDPDFDRFGARVHSFQLVEEVLAPVAPRLVSSFIELLVFDAAIGNSDRHHDNWGVILSPRNAPRLAPGYDHGSSLGSHIDEDKIETSLAPVHVDHYARAGQSRVGWREAGGTRRLRHFDLLRRIGREHSVEVAGALAKALDADQSALAGVLARMPDVYAGERRLLLIEALIHRRIALLRELIHDTGR